GYTRCNTGVQQCMKQSTFPDGTSCGTNMVCSVGQCVACTAGGSCPSPDPCRTATYSCKTRAQVCSPSRNAPGCSICGTDTVGATGLCVACVAGSDCLPTNSLCKKGQPWCSGAAQRTTGNDTAPDGTSCGTNYVCHGGSCAYCAAGGSCSTPP